jgi:hypothetical protein
VGAGEVRHVGGVNAAVVEAGEQFGEVDGMLRVIACFGQQNEDSVLSMTKLLALPCGT